MNREGLDQIQLNEDKKVVENKLETNESEAIIKESKSDSTLTIKDEDNSLDSNKPNEEKEQL